nr:replication protein A 70 kDa DNA-binding subunit B [Tanacetum cinerariifolium]
MTDGKSRINASGGEDSGSYGSVKRTYIDLDDYPDVDDEAKRSEKIVQVKIEPKDLSTPRYIISLLQFFLIAFYDVPFKTICFLVV